MKRTKIAAIVLVLGGLVAGFSASAIAGGGGDSFTARLHGFSEAPAISTEASGMFTAKVSPDGMTIDYELTYSGFSSTVSASHIHLGQAGVNGGVVAFLCGGGDKPLCPATEGTVTGTIDAADILDLPTQGIAAGELDEVLRAISRRVTYVNVHSATFASGEIRGQIRPA